LKNHLYPSLIRENFFPTLISFVILMESGLVQDDSVYFLYLNPRKALI
jgi:hypothetical protein